MKLTIIGMRKTLMTIRMHNHVATLETKDRLPSSHARSGCKTRRTVLARGGSGTSASLQESFGVRAVNCGHPG